MEAYSDSFYTTGITYQADNQHDPDHGQGRRRRRQRAAHHRPRRHAWTGASTPTTRLARNGVDPRNGGIVGTVSYDTTRNELDPQYAASEDWQPGISGMPVEALRDRRLRHDGSRPATRRTATSSTPDGSYAKGKLLNTYVTENWSRPTGCTARDVDGNPLVHGVDENVLAPNQETDGECISSFMQGSSSAPTRPTRAPPTPTSAPRSTATTASGTAASTGPSTTSDPADPVCDGGTFEPLAGR